MTEDEILTCAHDLAEALQDWAYTRKDEDKQRVKRLETELVQLCRASANTNPTT